MIHLCIVNSKATSTKIRAIYLCKAFPITTASTKNARDSFMQKQKRAVGPVFIAYLFSHTYIVASGAGVRHLNCISYSVLYAPHSRFTNSSCVPDSTISPWFTTTIFDALRIVDKRCAITNTVLSCIKFSMARWTTASDLLSRADVASSKIKIGAFFKNARAMATRCFCPPDNSIPRSPIWVSRPFFKLPMNPSRHAIFIAVFNCSGVASSFPSKMFSRIEPANKKLSWNTPQTSGHRNVATN